MDVATLARGTGAIVLLVWLPGYVWTRALLPQLSRLERFVMSIVLSVSLVTLGLVIGDVVFDLRLSGSSAGAIALGLSAVGLIPLIRRGLLTRRKERPTGRAPPR